MKYALVLLNMLVVTSAFAGTPNVNRFDGQYQLDLGKRSFGIDDEKKRCGEVMYLKGIQGDETLGTYSRVEYSRAPIVAESTTPIQGQLIDQNLEQSSCDGLSSGKCFGKRVLSILTSEGAYSHKKSVSMENFLSTSYFAVNKPISLRTTIEISETGAIFRIRTQEEWPSDLRPLVRTCTYRRVLVPAIAPSDL